MSRGGNPLALASTTPMLSDRITDAIYFCSCSQKNMLERCVAVKSRDSAGYGLLSFLCYQESGIAG